MGTERDQAYIPAGKRRAAGGRVCIDTRKPALATIIFTLFFYIVTSPSPTCPWCGASFLHLIMNSTIEIQPSSYPLAQQHPLDRQLKPLKSYLTPSPWEYQPYGTFRLDERTNKTDFSPHVSGSSPQATPNSRPTSPKYIQLLPSSKQPSGELQTHHAVYLPVLMHDTHPAFQQDEATHSTCSIVATRAPANLSHSI